MSECALKACLAPIIDQRARVLILGTLAGDESLRRQEYYGHRRNHFWPVIASAIGGPLHESYQHRVAMLTRNRLALWDVLASAERSGSLDSAIRNPIPNDFATLLQAHPSLRTIAFNGQRAHALYRRHIAGLAGVPHGRLTLAILPSTSPAHVRPLAEKAAQWKATLHAALND